MKGQHSGQTLSNVGRLIAQEASASDLLALLTELDSEPIAQTFDLDPDRHYEARREITAGNKGRLDLVIFDTATERPAAVIEMKGASDVRGDQLERYLAWANRFEPRPEVFLCAFDNDESNADPEWTRRRLRDVYDAWQDSPNQHAAWLARSIVELLDSWDEEADAELGYRTGHYVPDIVTKRLTRDLLSSLKDTFNSATYALPDTDKGGNPMVFAWTAHPRDPEDLSVAVGVDLRSSGRQTESTIWKLRPQVAVDILEDRDLRAARRLAFDLARRIYSHMGQENIRNELHRRGLSKITQALIPRPNDGFRKAAEKFDFEDWARRLAYQSQYPNDGLFFHDLGNPLSSLLYLDVADLTRKDLKEMTISILEILHVAAQEALQRPS